MKSNILGKCLVVAAALVLALACCGRANADDSDLKQKLDTVAGEIQKYMSDSDRDMTAAAQALGESGLTGPAARATLLALCNKRPSVRIDCSAVDKNGVKVTVEPASAYGKYEGSSIINQSAASQVLGSKKPVITGPAKSSEGVLAVDYEWPVFSKKGELIGSVSMYVEPLESIDEVVKPLLGRDTSDVLIVDLNGQIVYSRFHDDIGKNFLIKPTLIDGSSLTKILQQVTQTETGRGFFKTAPAGRSAPGARECVWKTIGVNGVNWRVVMVGNTLNN